MNRRAISAVVRGIVPIVLAHLRGVTASLDARVRALEDRPQIAGPPGKDGTPGKDGLNGRDGADGKDGKDGRDGDPGRDGYDGKDAPIVPGPPGERGEKGADGKDGTPGVRGEKGIDGRDGRDGINGKDGRDGIATTDELMRLIDAEVAKRLDAAVEKRVSEEFALRPDLRFLGVWKEGASFVPGNFVTFGGDIWHCNIATLAKPGLSSDWTLAVRHGRDYSPGRDR